ncbi:MAG: type IV pilus assembly protein PilM [Patescibacteria group bacterium]|nr:type IV pilus assembly protein PilM [Patescibacteria group bacterium]
MSLFNANLNAFGLDLSDRSVKVAQLKKRNGKMKVHAYGRENIPEGLIKDGEIKDGERVAEFIKKVLSKSKPNPIKSKFVVYSIPEPKGFIRVVELPRMKEENIDDAIRCEVEHLFPININESYIDWQVLPSDNNKIIKVLVAMVSSQLVDSYSTVFKKAGLKPIAAEIESVAITRSLISNSKLAKPILVIDLGKDRTGFIIFKNPTVQFTASIPICGNSFSKAISKKLKISEEEADKVRKKCGLGLSDEYKNIYKIIQPSLYDMVKYINDLMDYYKEYFKSESDIAKIVICGGEAKMAGISSFLSLRIKKEVEKGNPWVNIISFKDKRIPPISKEESLVFVTVLGLAMRGAEQ